MKQVVKFSNLIAAILGVLAIVFLAITPGMKLDTGSLAIETTGFSGFQAIFGYTETKTVLGVEVSAEILKANWLGIIAFVLLAVGVIAGVIGMVIGNKIANFVSAVALFVGGILLFLVPAAQSTDDITFKLSTWLIFSGIIAILGGLFGCFGIFAKGKK
ncbi:MAG TPA: hypothetical protein GXZ51_02890 [Acholeplasma sp.]|jgi:hypothetical protein|nr:hypothetical protein [Acholeplasma sp.]